MPTNKGNEPLIISHLTDVEGNLRYFQQWFDRSPYLQFNQGKVSFHKDDLHHKFIYGGDFCDKGPGDLRIGKALVDFKNNHPDKVTLIAGNRDIKCRRFSYELAENIRERLLYGESAYWNPTSLPRHYVVQQMISEGKVPASVREIEHFIQHKSLLQCHAIYLKWMLNETMGCGSFFGKRSTFENRRLELAQMTGSPVSLITDEMVTQTFVDSVLPEGVLTQYLKAAQLGEIVGETLFIHGAVTIDNMGFLPGMLYSDPRVSDAREWIDILNNWYSDQINEWLSHPHDEKLHTPGHKPLDKYVIANPNSIVTSNWYTNNRLTPIRDEVIQFLNRAGIYRVISGHQPFSDFPLIIRNGDLEVIVGDTSYSDRAAEEDNRGRALHNLTITQSENQSYASIDAIRKDGSSMILALPSRTEANSGANTIIGCFTDEGQLIRPVTSTQLGSSQLDGFKVIDKPVN
jgi:hypothetical protein